MAKSNDRLRIVAIPGVNSARINQFLSHAEPSVHLLGHMRGNAEAVDEILQDKAHTWPAFNAVVRGRERSRPSVWLLSPIDQWREFQGVVRIALGRSIELEDRKNYAGEYVPFIDLQEGDPRARIKAVVPVGAVALINSTTDGEEYVHSMYGLQPEAKPAMSYIRQVMARNAGEMPELHSAESHAAFPMTQDAQTSA